MSDEHPEFTLPDWGTDGAPPEPPADTTDRADAEVELEIRVEAQVLLSTLALPDRWAVGTIHGLVSATARSKDDDPADAQSKATAKALRRLTEAARRLGANAVVGTRLTATRQKGVAVVTAYGTAVEVSG